MISIKKNNNVIEISGHAGFNDYGKDIVCASVSSIIYTTINACAKIMDSSLDVEDKENMKIIIKTDDEIVNKLIENMMELLNSLHEEYPKNIIVKES